MPKIECVDKLGVFLTKKKRIKILVGGRASTKSTFVADVVLSKINEGKTACCAREFQNTIEDSVHSMLIDEIDRCEFSGFEPMATEIRHVTGGRAFYRGLSRNITSLKGLNNLDILWIEEGESLSRATLKVLTASVRLSAAAAKKLREAGKLLEVPEIWITMNRGSSKDPVAQQFLKRAEKELAKNGYYEDNNVMIMQINYDEIPKEWFISSGLESERLDDIENMTTAEYRHKWHGEYNDTVENAIIQADWFDACVDAHIKLGFKPIGQKKVAYDPSDSGDDPQGLVYKHGSVILEAQEMDYKSVDSATDFATDYANEVQADVFTWDVGGLGLGLKRQVSDAFNGKKVTFHQFDGGATAFQPDEPYMPVKGEQSNPKTNKETFRNKRAQCYILLADRMFRTWQMVNKRALHHTDDLISISSDCSHLDVLRAELCRVPINKRAPRKQILTKEEMRAMKIDSPNIGDSVMMMEDPVDIEVPYVPVRLQAKGWGR